MWAEQEISVRTNRGFAPSLLSLRSLRGVGNMAPLSFNTLAREKEFAALSDKQNENLQRVTKPHIESFNSILVDGFRRMLDQLDPREYTDPEKNKICSKPLDVDGLWGRANLI